MRRAVTMLVLGLLLAAVPTAAQAKGATAARISGGGSGGLPGGPIDVNGDGEPGSGTDLANLAEAVGMWTVLFEDGQSGSLDAAPLPAADRGPRYTITWTFPDGAGSNDKIHQWVWPYAPGGPITYLAPGQRVMDTRTKGGWYRAADNLRRSLIALGLPDRPALAAPGTAPAAPAPARPAPPAAPAVWPWVAAGLGLLVIAAVAVARRRSVGGASA